MTSELSKITEFESGENGGYAILDLTPAYQKNATKASRGFYLADSRRSLIIRDEFILKKANSEIYWFMQLEKNTAVEIHGNYAILSKNGKKMRVDFVTNATGAVISEMEAKNLPTSPQYKGTYDTTELYKKLAIRMKASGALNITVKLTPLDGSTNNFTVMDIPLENWKDEFESNADAIDWESVKFIRSDRTYSNGGYMWSDPIEHSYGYINDHSKVGAKISLINSAEVDCEALGIVAIYNEFDRLTWLKKISITIPKGKNEFTLLSDPIPNTHGMKIKMFILEDMETMRPFTQSFYLWKKSNENNGPVPQCTPVLYK